jgi:ribonuclease D
LRHRFRYVDTDAALEDCVAELRQHGVVGIDTEFMRTRTFFPIPALYQVAAGGRISIIDPTRIDAWRSFASLLEDPDVTIVMHSCSEDLEVFARHLCTTPTAIFDTQIAHAFLSDKFSASYSSLVAHYLDVGLEKQHTRSDWLARPLSPEQLDYAALDVAYLEPLYDVLRRELDRLGRTTWFEIESAALTTPRNVAPDDYFRGIRKAAHLDGRQLARLRLLTVWRERHVRERDLPRARFVADDVLVDIAQREALDRDDLSRILRRASGERRAGRKVQGLVDEMLELVAEAGRLADEALPQTLEPPLSRAESAVVRQLRDHAAARAAELGFAPELLARRRDLEQCLRHYLTYRELPPAYSGWRYPLLGPAFENILAAQYPGHSGVGG